MRVLKVRVTAPATSFRYPHFLIGQQITFDMPPPSTVYGHLASVLGELPDPARFRFAYRFTYEGRGNDLEHQHILSAGGSRSSFMQRGEVYPVSVDVTVQPHRREFLFRPELTLYLDDPALESAFRTPAFCVSLGRSQDLATIAAIEVVTLKTSARAYMEDTILPFSMRAQLARGNTVLMPRYIAAPPERRAEFDRYIVLRGRTYSGMPDEPGKVPDLDKMLQIGNDQQWWVDPETEVWQGAQRGLYFHSFV
jgi:CRISPR-associated protein Cas5t